jgi:hypothetical protein
MSEHIVIKHHGKKKICNIGVYPTKSRAQEVAIRCAMAETNMYVSYTAITLIRHNRLTQIINAAHRRLIATQMRSLIATFGMGH